MCASYVATRECIFADNGRDGEAGSGSGEQRLWDAARAEIRLPMPQSDVGAERDVMAAESLSGTPSGDQHGFPSCPEEQVYLCRNLHTQP